MLDNLVVNVDRRGRGQGEADAFIAAAARDDRSIYPDHFAGQVYQWPARIPRVDRRVGLQKPLELMPDPAAVLCADDSRSDCRLQSEGTADRQHPVANLHAIRISELRDG